MLYKSTWDGVKGLGIEETSPRIYAAQLNKFCMIKPNLNFLLLQKVLQKFMLSFQWQVLQFFLLCCYRN
jgi:hypothetical protein